MTPLLPAWAPNVHPLLVHFPIALLVTGVLLDIIAFGVAGPARARLRDGGGLLSVAGALASVATYLTGRAAADTVLLPGMAHGLVQEHWAWAVWTVWYFAAVGSVRLFLLMTARSQGARMAVVLMLAGVVGLALLVETSERGAELVYRYGVGVEVLPNVQP